MTRRLLEETDYDRRGSSRPPGDGQKPWLRRVTLSDVIAAIALLGMVLSVIGWRAYSPQQLAGQISAEAIARVALERRVDSLANQQQFTNYMLCVLVRRTDPLAVPATCSPVSKATP